MCKLQISYLAYTGRLAHRRPVDVSIHVAVRKSIHVHRVSFSTLIRQNYSGAIEVHPSAEAAPRHLARHWERTILVDFLHRMILGTAQPHCAEVSRPPSSASGKPAPGVDESFQR
jgi:hypothetical protein